MPVDYRTPSPDEGHEAIRAPLAQAIDDLAAQVERIDDAYLLFMATVDFAQTTLNSVTGMQVAIRAAAGQVQTTLADHSQQLAAIKARLDALENPPTT